MFMGVRVSGKGFFSRVTVGPAGWSGEETAAAFTPKCARSSLFAPL